MRIEIIIGGLGGQGSMVAGAVLGRAAVYDGKRVAQTRSYGAEARGGAARSELVVSDEEIDYPLVIKADVLIAMSQQAFDRYIGRTKENGIVIIDEDLVKPDPTLYKNFKIVKIPATRIASQELKRGIVANMVMIGALLALTGIVTEDSLIKAIREQLGEENEKINVEALRIGRKLAEMEWKSR